MEHSTEITTNVVPQVTNYFRNLLGSEPYESSQEYDNDFIKKYYTDTFKPVISKIDTFNLFESLFKQNSIQFLYLNNQCIVTAVPLYLPSYQVSSNGNLIIEYVHVKDNIAVRQGSLFWNELLFINSFSTNYIDSSKILTDFHVKDFDQEIGTTAYLTPCKETTSLLHHSFFHNYITGIFDFLARHLKNCKSQFDQLIQLINNTPPFYYIPISTDSNVTAFLTSYVSQTVNQTMQEIQMTNGAAFIRYKDITNKSFANGWSKWRRSDAATIGVRSYILTKGDINDLPLGTPYGNDDKFNILVDELLPGNNHFVFVNDVNVGGHPESLRLGSNENPRIRNGSYEVTIITNELGQYPIGKTSNPITNQISAKLEMSYNGTTYFQKWESLSAKSLSWSIEENRPRYYYTRNGTLNEDGNKINWSKWFKIDNVQTYKDLGSFSTSHLQNRFGLSNFSVLEILDLFDQPENTTYTITIFDPFDIVSGKPLTFDSHDSIAKWGKGYNQLNNIRNLSFDPSTEYYSKGTLDSDLKNIVKINSIYFKITKTKSRLIDSIEFKDLGQYWNVYDLEFDASNSSDDVIKDDDSVQELFSKDLYFKDLSSISKNGAKITDGTDKIIEQARHLIRPFVKDPSLVPLDEDSPFLKFNDYSDDWIYYQSIRKSVSKEVSEGWHSIRTELNRLEKRINYIEFHIGLEPGAVYQSSKMMVAIGHEVQSYLTEYMNEGFTSDYIFKTAIKQYDIAHGAMTRYGRSGKNFGIITLCSEYGIIDQRPTISDFWGGSVVSQYLEFFEVLRDIVRTMEAMVSGTELPEQNPYEIPDYIYTNSDVSSQCQSEYGFSIWDCIFEFWQQSYSNSWSAWVVLAILGALNGFFNFVLTIAIELYNFRFYVWSWGYPILQWLAEIILSPVYLVAVAFLRAFGEDPFDMTESPEPVDIYKENMDMTFSGLSITQNEF